MTRKDAAIYLAAMIDGEGCVDRPGGDSRRVRITNTDPLLIEAVVVRLTFLRIRHRVLRRACPKKKTHRQVFDVYVTGRDALRALLTVVSPHLASLDKRLRLQGLTTSYVRFQKPHRA